SIAVTSTSGDRTMTSVDAFIDPANFSTNQTIEWNQKATGASMWGAGDIGPGTGSTTHTWTAASGSIFGSGANIAQAAAVASADTAFVGPVFRSRMREW